MSLAHCPFEIGGYIWTATHDVSAVLGFFFSSFQFRCDTPGGREDRADVQRPEATHNSFFFVKIHSGRSFVGRNYPLLANIVSKFYFKKAAHHALHLLHDTNLEFRRGVVGNGMIDDTYLLTFASSFLVFFKSPVLHAFLNSIIRHTLRVAWHVRVIPSALNRPAAGRARYPAPAHTQNCIDKPRTFWYPHCSLMFTPHACVSWCRHGAGREFNRRMRQVY